MPSFRDSEKSASETQPMIQEPRFPMLRTQPNFSIKYGLCGPGPSAPALCFITPLIRWVPYCLSLDRREDILTQPGVNIRELIIAMCGVSESVIVSF